MKSNAGICVDMNVGLNLLRILLTLGVIMDHFWWRPDPESLHGIDVALWQLRTLAVPAFMTMTFFFTARHFAGGDAAWLKKRYLRLYEPFVFWAFACFLTVQGVSRFDPAYSASLKDLLWQLAFGHSEHLSLTQFWFHADLLVLTGAVFLAFRFVKLHNAQVHIALTAIAIGYSVQYSATAMEALFGWMPYEAKYPLGRIFPMLPYVGAGLLLASVKEGLETASSGMRLAIAAMGAWLVGWVVYCPVAPCPPSVVGYEGVNMSLIAWGMMATFYYIPFDRLPSFFSKAVLFLSKYSMGVYCIHNLMGKILFDHVFHLARTETPYGAITVAPGWFWVFLWGFSYLVCYFISLIAGSFAKRIVE